MANPLARMRIAVAVSFLIAVVLFRASHAPAVAAEEWMVTDNPPGHGGGRIVVGLRSEPKTLNPVLATDATSRDVIRSSLRTSSISTARH